MIIKTTKIEICNKLAMEIFSKDLSALKELELDFVNFQKVEFLKYKKKIAVKLREVENKKKLSTLEYHTIEDFFLKRVHIWDVLNGIKKGVEIAHEKGMPILSIGFFKPHIYALYLIRKKEISNHTFKKIPNLDKPWFFLFYKMEKEGELKKWCKRYVFDPYYGYKRI